MKANGNKNGRSLKRLFGPASLGLVITALSGLWSAAQNGQPGAGRKEDTAKPKYKNLRLLKDVPAERIIPIMREYNASLGVKCAFCHVINADHTGWEKDDKPPKAMARKMILLVRDLNSHQKSIGKQATCFMCHHGKPEPETRAPVEAPPPPRERGSEKR